MQSIKHQSLFVGSFITYKNHDNNNVKTNIVLLGQGWFAKGFLDHINSKKFYITNITRHEFVNTPMLLRTIDNRNKYEKNNNFIKKIDKIVIDEINKIDLKNKYVQTQDNRIYWENGYLVCGLGSNEDIGKKWESIIDKNKNTNEIKKYCIVGSGPTGTELAFYLNDQGHYINLYDILDEKEVYNYLSNQGRDIILDKIKKSNIKLFCGKPYNNTMKDEFNEVIFATGSKPNDLTKGWIITPKLNLKNHYDVFFGGDCNNENKLPKNAQVAYQQGKYIAETLNNGEKEKDFKFNNNGIALYCGNGNYYVETKFLERDIKCIIPNILVELYYSIFS